MSPIATPAQRAVRLQHRLGASGAVLAGAAVALWAYASHGVGDPEAGTKLANAAILALLHGAAVAAIAPQAVVGGERLSLVMLLAGALLFSGSIAAHQAWGLPTVAAPLGGLLLMAGWLWLAITRLRR